jgi:hypothetical protein
MRYKNRLYTLEGESQQETLGSWMSAAFKANKINLSMFKLPQFKLPENFNQLQQAVKVNTKSLAKVPETIVKAPIKAVQRVKINVPKMSIPPVKMSLPAPRINVPRVNFKSLTTPKNPFAKKQEVDQASSYQDFMNEIEQQQQNNYAPEPSYSPIEQQEEQSFSQADIEQEIDSTPIYGYTKNELMGISLKLGKPKLKLKAPKIGTKLNFGRKKPNLLQKLTLKKGKTKIGKITPKELKTGLAVTGAVAGLIATGGTAGVLAGGLATATGIGASSIVGGASIVATGSVLGSTLFANGSPTIASALNATGALLSNPTVQDKIPLAQNANTAINTGLDYYNTGSGIAETLGFKPPSLGTTSQEFFGLLSNSEKPTLDRALNIPQNKPTTGGMVPFKNPVTDPSHPLYIPPTGKQGQQGQTKIPTPDRPPTMENSSSSIGIIVGIGLLGYLFMNKKGKK